MSIALIAATILTASAKNDDPVLMTINKKPVTVSEFEYLYHKNNSQQLQKQTLDEYVDMFVTYKLKVADAEAAGIDTTASFIKEFTGYRNELATPYLRDNSVEERLINEAYARMGENVDVSHIMFPLGMLPKEADSIKAVANNIRTEIINGGNFEELALKYSIDPSVRMNKGRMGYIAANRYPYSFEKAAYETAVGELSPVIESPFGYHIIKVHARRPDQGKVLVQHILKLNPRDRNPQIMASQKAAIDSIYNVVKNGADFSDVAKRESEDPGSARSGGMLPWFGAGEMVKEFEDASFNLKNGEISTPFATAYGYHIIHRIDNKGIAPLDDDLRKLLINSFNNDERGQLAEKTMLESLKAKYNPQLVQSTLDIVREAIVANDGYDSVVIRQFANSNLPIIKICDTTHPLSEVIKYMPATVKIGETTAMSLIKDTANRRLDVATFDYERERLAETQPEFRNLINEYRDGMLLFEISNRNVWEKSSKDKEGLENYFTQNRSRYTWTSPKYKGFIIHTANDSINNAVKQYLQANKPATDSVTRVLRKEFGKNIKVERVVAAKGENAVVDYIMFSGSKPATDKKWPSFVDYQSRVIAMPEEVADVRGLVTSDYQVALEKEWIESLKAKYPVKINQKVLNKVK